MTSPDEFAWLGEDLRAELADILRDARPKWEAEINAMGSAPPAVEPAANSDEAAMGACPRHD